MKKIAFVIFLMIFTCKANTQPNLSEYHTFLTNFYTWYLSEAYGQNKGYYLLPKFKKVGATKYLLDFESIRSKLLFNGFFSTQFIKNDSIKISICNAKMQEYEWDYEPEPEFNIPECSFLWSDRICGGKGEDLNCIEIGEVISAYTNRKTIEVFIKNNAIREYKTKVEVVYDQVNNCLLINNIDVEWIRYK